MGKVLRVLANEVLDANRVCEGRFVLERCENFHLHSHNIRLEFDSGTFLKAFPQHPSLQVPGPYTLLDKIKLEPRGAGQVLVEQCENLYREKFKSETGFDEPTYVHIHYRDLRLEVSEQELHTIAAALARASRQLALIAFFRSLEAAGVGYVVLRGWERFPDVGGYKDVDMVVDDRAKFAAASGGIPSRTMCGFQYEIRLGPGTFMVDLNERHIHESMAKTIIAHRQRLDYFYVPEDGRSIQ